MYFTKRDAARFIGHLDLQSLFQKAFKRAGLPIAYSEGFNPHQLLSFAAPLPLGTSGDNEILEVFTLEQMPPDAVINRLNPQLPAGISVLRVCEISSTGKGAAALAQAATYRITFVRDNQFALALEDAVKNTMSSTIIEIEKKTKKGLAMTDIRPDILKLETNCDADKTYLMATLSTGSTRNLKPDVLVAHLFDIMGVNTDSCQIFYERTAMLLNEETP